MSGTHEYGLAVEIENPALRELLIKHKQAGAFDMIKAHFLGPYGHLLIADTIGGVDHDFCFRDASLSRNGAKWAFPQNVHQLLPYIVTIIAKAVYYPSEEKAASFYAFRDDVAAHRDEIYRSYRYARCWFYQADIEYRAGGSTEEKLFEIDREGKVSHKEKRRVIDDQDVSRDTAAEEDSQMHYLLVPEQSEEMRALAQKEEAEAARLLQSIEYEPDPDDGQGAEAFRLPRIKGRKRDIREFRIWQETEEGQREMQKERAELRKKLAAELEKKGGDACPIDVLELWPRAYDRLVRANISTIGELRKMTFDDLLHTRMGRLSACHLVLVLAEYGIIVPGAPEQLLLQS